MISWSPLRPPYECADSVVVSFVRTSFFIKRDVDEESDECTYIFPQFPIALTIAMDAARFAGGRGIVLAVHAKVKAKPGNLGFR